MGRESGREGERGERAGGVLLASEKVMFNVDMQAQMFANS